MLSVLLCPPSVARVCQLMLMMLAVLALCATVRPAEADDAVCWALCARSTPS